MKVITIGSDTKLFETGSVVQKRQVEYAERMEELHIVVFTTSKKFYAYRVGNLFVYPTHSKSRYHYVFDAYRLGKKIIADNNFVRGKSVVSGQDTGESGLSAYFLSRRFRFPLQLQMHTDVFSPFFGNTFLNRMRRFLARYLIPRATGVRVVSQGIVASLHRRFPHMDTRISVLPIYVDIPDIESFTPKKDINKEFPQFNFILFMASRLTKEKNIGTAIRALADIVKKFPHVGLVIAGSGPEKSHLHSLAETLDISHNVVCIGWQDDLISYYKTANVFLLTSLYEGYGMSLVEAAASGCPIVTTRVGIAPELFENGVNASLCAVRDQKCFTSEVLRLISDNALRELYKVGVQATIRKLSVSREKYVTEYVTLLEKLL
jgi:glycosyltransferase involved in cell wall biosynthesis